MKPLNIVLYSLLIIIFYSVENASATANQIVVTKFELVPEIMPENKAKVKLNTDAPDNIMLSVYAYRTYDAVDKTTKNKNQYMVYYFNEKTTAGKLKQGLVYELNHKKWREDFEAERANDTISGITSLPEVDFKQGSFHCNLNSKPSNPRREE